MRSFLSLLAGVLCAIPLAAQITLPPQIGDYMVLQQQAQVCLWGWAPPGGKVSVSTSWDKAGYTVTASSDGAWKVSVQTPEGSFQEQSIRIQCRGESRVLEHVLIGEVWMASGQSNMEMPLRGFDNCPVEGGPQEIVQAGRYAFRNWLPGNLSGANGLAVPPFRTDRLLEGEIPTGLSSEPDGDFTGHWTGEVNLPQMGDAHLVFDYRLSHDGNGRWTCRLPDGSVTPVSVNGRKMTGLSVQTGSVDLPIDLKSTDDGTVLVEIMGNPLTTLIREVL